MEGVFEDESQLRRCVENELLSDINISPEQALKVHRKIPHSITEQEQKSILKIRLTHLIVGLCCS